MITLTTRSKTSKKAKRSKIREGEVDQTDKT